MLHNRRVKAVLPSHQSDQELAEKFCVYFSSKVKVIRDGLDAETVANNIAAHCSEKNHRLDSFDLASEEEIKRIVNNSPCTSSPDDPVPTWILKKHLNRILPSITAIVNASLETGVFPSSFKKAVVRPLLKKPRLDPDNLKNYRPVSNLKFISKILERVVAKRLQEYLEDNDLDEPLQSAYKKHHSTESALIKVHNDIAKSLDQKQAVFLVLLDMSAAFDTIDREILIERFRSIGVTGSALAWISSYLGNRVQTVKIGECLSSEVELPYGVPQGSVLGPSFFSIYASPLADIARSHGINIHLYADDTQLYTTFNPCDPLSEASSRLKLEACIDDMRAWMVQNKMKLNDDKTEFMVIASKNLSAKIHCRSIRIGHVEVQSSTSCRNLGVHFDSELSMSSHIAATCRSVYFQLRNVHSIRKSLSSKVAASVIHSYIISRIDYGNALLYNSTSLQLAKLQRAQNSAARVLSGRSRFSRITPVLKKLHWLPVTKRIEYKILLHTWKTMHDQSPVYMQDLISEYVPGRNLRSSNKKQLNVPKTNLSVGEKAFSASAPFLWNALPLGIRSADSLETFKKQLKSHLFLKYFR